MSDRARADDGGLPFEPPWPEPPDAGYGDAELLQLRYAAQLAEVADVRATERKQDERAETRYDETIRHDRELHRAETAAYLEAARGAIDRARSAAEATRNAAAAIGTIYTTLLGVAYAADKGTPLPARGVIPAVFLGIAVVFATAHGALMHTGRRGGGVRSSVDLLDQQDARLAAFILWTGAIAKRNAWALYAAVYSLGLGVASLPVAFVQWRGVGPWVAAGAGVLVILVGTLVTHRVWTNRDDA